MKKVLVTGGAGFIGSHVVKNLILKGAEVVVLDDLSGGSKENIHPNAKFVKGSITNHKLVNKLFKKHKFDYVYHLAAYAAEGLSPFIKRFNYENNVIGSVNLINASITYNVKCFVFTSSIAVYGNQKMPVNEKCKKRPIDSYGIAKYTVEQELKQAKDQFGLDYIIFRPHNVYGINQNFNDKYRNVIAIFIRNLIENKPITIFGDGQQERAFTHVDSVAEVIAGSVINKEAYNKDFDVGSMNKTKIIDLAKIIIQQGGRSVDNYKIRFEEERHEAKIAWSKNYRCKYHFDVNFEEVPLEIGIAELMYYAQNFVKFKKPKNMKLEIDKGFYEVWK